MPINQRTNENKTKGVADIVFLFDCTGSMSPYINAVKNNVTALVEGFKSYPEVVLDWRVRTMGFRDITCDSEAILNGNSFVDNESAFVSQLSSLTADGGGDYEESALDAIWYAIKRSEWRTSKCTKVLVIFTDAGTKPVHEKTMDELGVADDLSYLGKELTKGRFQLFFFGPEDPAFAELQKVERTHINFCDLSRMTNADFADVLKVIGKTVSESSNTEGKTF